MGIEQLSSTLAKILLPALPYLVLAGKKAAEKVGSKIGETVWETAQSIWEVLLPHFRKKQSTLDTLQEVAQDVEKRPDDQDAFTVLRFVIRKTLEENQSLTPKLEAIIRQSQISSGHHNVSLVGSSLQGGIVMSSDNSTAIGTIHIGDVITRQVAGKTLEMREVHLDLELDGGGYPTLYWVDKVSAADIWGGASSKTVKVRWKPDGYSYDKMKERLLAVVNEWIVRGWEVVEGDLDNLWLYDDESRRTLGSLLGDLLGPLGGLAWEHKRVFYGAKFHVRRVVEGG